MTDREKLIIEQAEYFSSLWSEKLKDAQEKPVVRSFISGGVTLADQVASSIKQVSSSKWIPVAERLPQPPKETT